MSETSFPINDLLRRKLQTGLTIASLTLCVTLTVYLLLFAENVGIEISQVAEGRLTAGFSMVFSQFLFFIGILIVATGAVVVSFMVFVMMSQRAKDIGLMRATGCPSDLIFGYFMTELLIIAFVSCSLGVIVGILANYASVSLSNLYGFQILHEPINFWLVLLVFVLFFALAIIFGVKPILDATKVEPARAISPTYHFGLSKEPGFKVISKSSLTFKIALRSLFRRKSATIRIFLCLTIVFTLITVAIAGGIIADQTTKSWVEKAVGRDIILIAHRNMCDQYKRLLSRFHELKEDSEFKQFNYTDKRYLISEDLLNMLRSISGIGDIDARLVLKEHAKELQGYILGQTTGDTQTVGDDREGESLIVGVEPEKVLGEWFVEGRFPKGVQAREAVIGDSLAQRIFSMPLYQSIMLFNGIFNVTGVCVDPINNGNVTYVPLETLQNVTGILEPNIVMVKVDPAILSETLDRIRATVGSADLEVFELNEALEENLSFLGHVWSVIMFLPLISLIAASLCLVGYVVLAIAEQRQELGVLRALGIKSKAISKIVSEQSSVILLSSFGVGVPIGIILTLLFLVPEPIVTSYTVVEIAGWLLIGLLVVFVSSLYPTVKFARKPILEIMNRP